MAEMIDRVAKALMNHTAEIDRGEGWDDASEAWRENYRGHARAALAALSEPTDAMLSRGGYHCITGAGAVSSGDKAQAKAVWKAMIKVVLDDA